MLRRHARPRLESRARRHRARFLSGESTRLCPSCRGRVELPRVARFPRLHGLPLCKQNQTRGMEGSAFDEGFLFPWWAGDLDDHVLRKTTSLLSDSSRASSMPRAARTCGFMISATRRLRGSSSAPRFQTSRSRALPATRTRACFGVIRSYGEATLGRQALVGRASVEPPRLQPGAPGFACAPCRGR